MNALLPLWLKHSVRLLMHEFKRGELTVIFLSLVLSVATVFSLTGFSNSIKNAILTSSTSFIAADRVLQSSRPISDELNNYIENKTEKQAIQLHMSSMAYTEDDMMLVSLRSVTADYPLRGELKITDKKGKVSSVKAPHQGQVWVDKKLVQQLSVAINGTLEIGDKTFIIAGIIDSIPDASFSVFTAGPTVFINYRDLGATHLLQPGSRVSYEYLFTGEKTKLKQLDEWIKPKLNEVQRWVDIQSSQSPLSNALNRSEKYLSLASMLGIVLASVAVSVASRRYSQKHKKTVSVFKALGSSQQHINRVYLSHWFLLTTAGVIVGLIIGYLLLKFGLVALNDTFGMVISSSLWSALWLALFTGFISVTTFAFTPLLDLVKTPALLVIRSTSTKRRYIALTSQLLPLMGMLLLLFVFSGDLYLSFIILLASLLVVALLMLLSQLVMSAGRSVGSHAGRATHLAVANIKRRAKENSIQLVSFTVAIQLLLLLLVVKNDLIDEWQQQLPEFTANRFLVNVQQQEVAAIEKFIQQRNIPSSKFYPVVRGRLIAVNEEKIAKPSVTDAEHKSEKDNGRRGIGRELNLTWQDSIVDVNEIVEGTPWKTNENGQVSIEQGIAKRLNINIGDKLTFQLGSETFTVPVTSIRKVNWQSMTPNFFMIFNPAVLSTFPATYIASMYINQGNDGKLQHLLSQHPTITVIDVEAMINQLRTVINQVSMAIQFILVLVILAGSLVLIAQVQASMEQRERELAILRTLGANGNLLKSSILYEFVIQGAIAGLLASATMEIAVYFIQQQLFQMEPSMHWSAWAIGISVGAIFVGVIGYLSCYRLLRLTSVTLIRRTL